MVRRVHELQRHLDVVAFRLLLQPLLFLGPGDVVPVDPRSGQNGVNIFTVERLRWDPISAMQGMLLGTGLVVATATALVPLRGEANRAIPALALIVPVVVAGWVGTAPLPAHRRDARSFGVVGSAFLPAFIHPPGERA